MKHHSEMTANVWKILKNVGDQVYEGDEVVILESMKMEIPVAAEGSGKVLRMEIEEGAMVSEGDLIFELEQ